MRATELAWTAGFFDGEGNVGCWEHTSTKQATAYRLQAQISQMDREVLDRFQDAVGVGNVTGPYFNRSNGRTSFRWGTTCRGDIEIVARLLSPYLGRIKAAQFGEALAMMEAYRADQKERQSRAARASAPARWRTRRCSA